MVYVDYYCPRCGALAQLDRETFLADREVTAEPIGDRDYGSTYEDFESDDGVVIVCGAQETIAEGCGEPYYVNFVTDPDEVSPLVADLIEEVRGD